MTVTRASFKCAIRAEDTRATTTAPSYEVPILHGKDTNKKKKNVYSPKATSSVDKSTKTDKQYTSTCGFMSTRNTWSLTVHISLHISQYFSLITSFQHPARHPSFLVDCSFRPPQRPHLPCAARVPASPSAPARAVPSPPSSRGLCGADSR